MGRVSAGPLVRACPVKLEIFVQEIRSHTVAYISTGLANANRPDRVNSSRHANPEAPQDPGVAAFVDNARQGKDLQ